MQILHNTRSTYALSSINLIAVNQNGTVLVLNEADILVARLDEIKMSGHQDIKSKRRQRLREIEWSIACTSLALSGVGAFLTGVVLILLAWTLGSQVFWIGLALMVTGCGLMWAWKHFFWDAYLHQIENLS